MTLFLMVLYVASLLAVTLYLLTLLHRLVRAHERVADALEKSVRPTSRDA